MKASARDSASVSAVDGSAPSERRLVLIRHGRSSHVHSGWIDVGGFRRWRETYEAVGIRDDERAPRELGRLAAGAGVALSSDAQRAVASARLLLAGREIVVSPLLRELDLEPPALAGVRLPLAAWAIAVGARVLGSTLRGNYPPPAEAARVERARAWLDELAAEHALIVAVTHASFRRQLAQRLSRAGWRAEPGSRSVQHWSAWAFRRRL